MIEYIAIGFSILLLIPTLVFFVQVVLGLLKYQNKLAIDVERPSLVVLVPAHNESEVLGNTLVSIKAQLKPEDRMIVIADNCTDNTAAIAKQYGAEVIERFNKTERGKGFALEYGILHIAKSPPEIIIMIDADCHIMPNSIDFLAKTSVSSDRPVQALYLMQAAKNAKIQTRFAEFAWIVKNKIRPLGYSRLGLPCGLMGTGMAFPWHLISKAQLGSSEIVEDLKLGLDFACVGSAPIFCPEAVVISYFPSNDQGAKTQRTRWEHGHLALIISQVPRLVKAVFDNRNLTTFYVALDLAVPPLALLTMGIIGVSLFNAIVFFMIENSFALILSSIGFILLFLAVTLSWHYEGRRLLSASELVYAPVYALRKIPIYIKFIIDRQVEWVRSSRDV